MIIELRRGEVVIFTKHFAGSTQTPDELFVLCLDYLLAEQVISAEEREQLLTSRRIETSGPPP